MAVPNFFLVGAAKAGTTSLWQYLSDHPEIYMSQSAKEPHYFLWANEETEFDYGDWRRVSKPYHNNWDAYLKLFDGAQEPVVGEASVFYLPHVTAPDKIKARCPDAKILISLRNPVQRAFSWYNFNRMRHEESAETFMEALKMEQARVQPYYAAQYIGLGLYAEQVKRYYDTFGKDQVHLVLFDDLVTDTASVCRDIFRFLNVDESVEIQSERTHNPTVARHPILDRVFKLKAHDGVTGRMARQLHGALAGSNTYLRLKQSAFNYADKLAIRPGKEQPKFAQMTKGDIALLHEIFDPDIERLENLIGRDLTAWKNTGDPV